MPQNEWTLTGGLIRATIGGAVVSLVLAAVVGAIGALAPVMVLNGFLRCFVSFGVAWLIIKAVHRAGGSVGWPFSILAFLYALAAMTLALAGLAFSPAAADPQPGGSNPLAWVAFATLLPAMGGAAGAVWLEHEG